MAAAAAAAAAVGAAAGVAVVWKVVSVAEAGEGRARGTKGLLLLLNSADAAMLVLNVCF